MRLGSFAFAVLVLAGPLLAAAPPNPEAMLGKPSPKWGVTEWMNLPEGKETLGPEDFRGKVLGLVFCQKTCKGSQSHILPLVKRLADHYKDEPGVAFVVVQTAFQDFETNTFAAVREMAETHHLAMPFGHTGGQGAPPKILIRHKARGTPWIVILDAEGKIRKSGHHFPENALVTFIDNLKSERSGSETPSEPSEKDEAAEEAPPEPKPLSPSAKRLKEQLDQLAAQMNTLASKEMDLRLAIMKGQQKAGQVVKNAHEAAKEIARGHLTRELRLYRDLMGACIHRLNAHQKRYASIGAGLARLSRKSAAKELEADFERLTKQVQDRRRNLLDQIAGLHEKAGNLKEAVEIYERLREAVPAKDKAGRRTYSEKIAGAYERYEEWGKALSVNIRIYGSLTPEKQKKEINLRLKLGNLYQRVGNYAKALEMFKGVKEDLPPGQEIDGLDNAIAQLEQRV